MKKHLLQALLAAALLSFLFTGCSKDPDFSYSSPDSIGTSSGKIKNGSIHETPIEFNIDIPAGTQEVNIYRRRVDKLTHSPMEEWRRIAGTWIDNNNDPDYNTYRSEYFWDKYVQNNKCYEYKVDTQPAGGNTTSRNLGFHLAGYEGYEEPYFDDFPEISYDADNKLFSITSNGTIVTDYYENDNEWFSYNLSYGWCISPWLDQGSNTTYNATSEFLNLRPGNNNLTSFTLKVHFENEYFDTMVDLDVNNDDIIINIPRSIPGPLGYDDTSVGVYTQVQPINNAKQIFIERAIDDGYTTLDDSAYETVGFMNIDEGSFADHYNYIDYFYDGYTTYNYRAKFIMSDWSTEIVLDMGTVQITAAGYDEDSLSFSPSIEFNYDYDDNDNLYWYQSNSNYQDLYVFLGSSPYSLNTLYDDPVDGICWGGYIVFEYVGIDSAGNSHKMWPSFNSLGNMPDKNYSVNFDPELVPSFWDIPDEYMTFDLTEVDIDLYLPGTEIPRRFKYTSLPIPVGVSEVAQIDLDLSPYFD